MSRHDLRCALTGVSLLDAEVALLLVERRGDEWHPASLPLWGVYDGTGALAEFREGPNAERLVEGWSKEVEEGRVSVDFAAMGLSEQPFDSLEMMLGLMACSQLGGFDAVRVEGRAVGFVLVSAHVAAYLMELEPELSPTVTLEALPDAVFSEAWGRRLYAGLSNVPLSVRCKFGISLAGLLALTQRLPVMGVKLVPTGEAVAEERSEVARHLAEAMVRFAGDELMLAALEEYAGQFDEEAAYD